MITALQQYNTWLGIWLDMFIMYISYFYDTFWFYKKKNIYKFTFL